MVRIPREALLRMPLLLKRSDFPGKGGRVVCYGAMDRKGLAFLRPHTWPEKFLVGAETVFPTAEVNGVPLELRREENREPAEILIERKQGVRAEGYRPAAMMDLLACAEIVVPAQVEINWTKLSPKDAARFYAQVLDDGVRQSVIAELSPEDRFILFDGLANFKSDAPPFLLNLLDGPQLRELWSKVKESRETDHRRRFCLQIAWFCEEGVFARFFTELLHHSQEIEGFFDEVRTLSANRTGQIWYDFCRKLAGLEERALVSFCGGLREDEIRLLMVRAGDAEDADLIMKLLPIISFLTEL